MTARDCCRYLLDANPKMVHMYLSDLSDEDLLVRPAPGANHIAYQMGHLIVGEVGFFHKGIPGVKSPELPAGFADLYGPDKAANDAPTGYKTKAEYLALFDT